MEMIRNNRIVYPHYVNFGEKRVYPHKTNNNILFRYGKKSISRPMIEFAKIESDI